MSTTPSSDTRRTTDDRAAGLPARTVTGLAISPLTGPTARPLTRPAASPTTIGQGARP